MDKFKDFTLNPTAYPAPKMQVSRVALLNACAYGSLHTPAPIPLVACVLNHCHQLLAVPLSTTSL